MSLTSIGVWGCDGDIAALNHISTYGIAVVALAHEWMVIGLHVSVSGCVLSTASPMIQEAHVGRRRASGEPLSRRLLPPSSRKAPSGSVECDPAGGGLGGAVARPKWRSANPRRRRRSSTSLRCVTSAPSHMELRALAVAARRVPLADYLG